MSSQKGKYGGGNAEGVSEETEGATGGTNQPIPCSSSQPPETGVMSIPSVIEDLPLRTFLLRFGEAMTAKDLENLQFLTQGFFGPGVTEGLDSPIRYFNHLWRAAFLSPNNIVVLQMLVWLTGRRDLHNMLAKFGEEHPAVLQMCIPNPVPVCGYKPVNIHLKGKPLSKDDVEDVRSKLARMMDVPLLSIITTGIQPTGSWFVTFMVPEYCSDNLLKLAKRQEKWFAGRGVDVLEFGHEKLFISEDASHSHSPDTTLNMKTEYSRLMAKNRHLEQMVERLSLELTEGKGDASHTHSTDTTLNMKTELSRLMTENRHLEEMVERLSLELTEGKGDASHTHSTDTTLNMKTELSPLMTENRHLEEMVEHLSLELTEFKGDASHTHSTDTTLNMKTELSPLMTENRHLEEMVEHLSLELTEFKDWLPSSMDPGHILKVNRKAIVRDVTFRKIRNQLIQDSVLTLDDAERCAIAGTEEDQMVCLLDMLPKKGPDAYRHFRSALEKDFPWIVERLDYTELPAGALPGNGAQIRELDKGYGITVAKSTGLHESSSPLPSCDQHGQPYSIFCIPCDELICNGCLSDHHGHRISAIQTVCAKLKTPLVAKTKECKKMNNEVTTTMSGWEEVENDVKRNGFLHQMDIERAYTSALEVLNTWRRKSLDTVDKQEEEWTGRCKASAKELKMMTEELQRLMATSHHLISNDTQFVQDAGMLTTRMDNQLKELEVTLNKQSEIKDKLLSELKKNSISGRKVIVKERTVQTVKEGTVQTEREGTGQTVKGAKRPDVLPVSKPEIKFTRTDHRRLKISDGGSVVAGGVTWSQAWTDGCLHTDRVYWEVELSVRPSPGDECYCRTGVVREGCDLRTGQSGRDCWWMTMCYSGDQSRCYSHQGGEVTTAYQHLTRHSTGAQRLGVFLDCEAQTLTFIDCHNNRVMCTVRGVCVSDPGLSPVVCFYSLGDRDSAVSARLVTGDRATLPQVLSDMLQVK